MLIILNNPNSLNNQFKIMEDDENDEFDKPEGNFQMSRAITKNAASERQERVNAQAKMKQPIWKKNLL